MNYNADGSIDVMVDNSSISTNSCSRRYQLQCVWGCEVPAGVDASFGNAVHRILEYFVLEPEASLERKMEIIMESGAKYGVYTTEKLQRVGLCAEQALKKLPPVLKSPLGRPLVENKFKVYYKRVVVNYQAYNIYLTGTIDYTGSDGRQLVFFDYKTFAGKAANDKLTEYALKFQMPFYSWVSWKFGDQVYGPGVAADLSKANKMRGHYMLISHNLPMPEFRTSIGYAYSANYFEEVVVVVDDAIDDMLETWSRPAEMPAIRDGMTNDSCKYCYFKAACITRDPVREAAFVNRLQRKPYDPLSFR